MFEAKTEIGEKELRAKGKTKGKAVMKLIEAVKQTPHYQKLKQKIKKQVS